jgi:hypothetical protein
MANLFYNKAKQFILSDGVNFINDTIKVMLVTGYTPLATHQYKSDVSGEITGTGYTAGGATLANKTTQVDNTNNLGYFTADPITWVNATVSATGAVIYKDTGTPSTSPVICFIDFGGTKTASASDFVIQWSATGGIVTLQ